MPALPWTRRALTFALLCALPAGLPATPAAATATLASETAVDVTGRYIVTPTDGARSDPFTAALSPREADQLAADPAVQAVEPDRIVHVEATTQRNPSWGLDRIDQRAGRSRSFRPSDDGSAVTAYVIDSGVRITHREFAGRASYGWDFVGRDKVANDCQGHGTHVAGILGGTHYGVAKKVKLVSLRVLDCRGAGYLSDVIKAVNWVTRYAHKPAVANMSLDGGGFSPALNRAITRSIASGVTYAVAAGNNNANACSGSPGAAAAAITVAATDSRDRRAGFSDYGKCVDIFAPGVNITSSTRRSNTTTGLMSGTSMATPMVAGAAALVLDEHPTFRPSAVRQSLVSHATTGKVANRGARSPNRLLFVTPPPAAAKIRTAVLPAATYGTAYRTQLTLVAGRRGTWSFVGALPAGLRLSSTGVLSGTPRKVGTVRIAVRFTDWVPTAVTRTLTVNVGPAAAVLPAAAL